MAAKVKYTINLVDVFNRAYSGVKTRNKLRPLISNPSVVNAYSNLIIDEIIERTSEKKIGKDSRSLGTYSKSYAKSAEGKLYGKTQGGRVNLKATGSMLNSMRSTIKPRSIIINLPDQTENDKAHGHITGMRGKRRRRDFLGLPKKVEEDILREVLIDSSQFVLIDQLSEAFASNITPLDNDFGFDFTFEVSGG